MNVEPFNIEMTFSVCLTCTEMHETSSNRQEIISPKHWLQEGDGLSLQHYVLPLVFVEEPWEIK